LIKMRKLSELFMLKLFVVNQIFYLTILGM
jgi:hypothetical protein